MKRLAGQLGLFLIYGASGALLVLIAGAVYYLESREDLDVWHRADLKAEYSVDDGLTSYADYLALEEELFRELDAEVHARVAPAADNLINRYVRGSLSSPGRWERNWNRSYELGRDEPVAGVLMLHGMSDSPYSLSSMAERLHARGMHVVGLRYPGHGTAPAGLTRTTWEDMDGAVELAARHLVETVPDKPLYVFGYSTGGPLAVELSLRALRDDSLRVPDGLVLFSPAMGITPLAALTPWQARLGRLLGLEKLAWNSIELEYDPFKYRSFPLNAALQVWRLANHVNARLADAEAAGGLENFPPVLSFQSVVDNTIVARAVVDTLYSRLQSRPDSPDHALVVYDFNRSTAIEPLLSEDPRPVLEQLLADSERDYEFTVVSNRSEDSPAVLATTGVRGERRERVCELEAVWTREAYSLSHIALPFPPDDPLYGSPAVPKADRIGLGNVVLRGEAGALRVSAAGFLRQSFNPFFEYQMGEITRFMSLAGPSFCQQDPD
jgi:alpha-beta hydrolase superfamily lysophospholipase